jgi:hypothetical protein
MIIDCRVMEPELAHVVSEKNEAFDRTEILHPESPYAEGKFIRLRLGCRFTQEMFL